VLSGAARTALGPAAAIERFCRDVPTVLFDSNIEGMGEAFVGSDNFSFVQQTVEYLCRTGSPPCFFEMRNPANPNANKRRKAYLQIMEAAGLEPHVVSVEGEGWGFEEIGRQGAHDGLGRGFRPTRSCAATTDSPSAFSLPVTSAACGSGGRGLRAAGRLA
jgi:DNA-binding LacI/PurR family transcriptional regulator